MLRVYFAQTYIETQHAFEDADFMIVKAAVEKSCIYDFVEIVGEDIGLIVDSQKISQMCFS